jgi:hypothetical protein
VSALDAWMLLAFIAYCTISGLRARSSASRSLEEYYLAGRSLSGWKAGISMAATQFAADTPLLVTGLVASAGIFALWRLWIYALSFLLMGFLLARSWRRAGVLTDAELSELRYGTRLSLALRIAKAFYFGALFNCTVLAMVLFAAARVAEPFLRWEEILPGGIFEPVVGFVRSSGISLTGAADPAVAATRSASNLISLAAVISVTLLYSTAGGLRAVVNTDLLHSSRSRCWRRSSTRPSSSRGSEGWRQSPGVSPPSMAPAERVSCSRSLLRKRVTPAGWCWLYSPCSGSCRSIPTGAGIWPNEPWRVAATRMHAMLHWSS